MNINIILTAKPGYQHSAALLEPARYVAYKLRESGHQVSMHVNRFADAALNVVFGAHEFYEPEWFSKGEIAIFNLEQLARGSQDSHRLDPGYLELLKKYPVIDYDLANIKLYRDHGSELSSLSVPVFEFGYAPYLDVGCTVSIKDRPIDILFFGSLNEKRIKTLRRIEDCDVRIKYITPDAPVYGDELNHLIRNAKAVLNIPFYHDRVFEQVRVSHALSCGTPVISSRSDCVPAKYIDSITWFDEGREAELFAKNFKTTEWYAGADSQLETWRESGSSMSFNDWEEMTQQAKVIVGPRRRPTRTTQSERSQIVVTEEPVKSVLKSPSGHDNHADRLGPKCTIIIPVYNKVELTKQCIESILEVTPESLYKLVVVDNASTDATADYLATLKRQATVISNPNNRGFVDACNMGASVADTDYLIFLNNDTVVVQGWLESLVATLDSDVNIGAAGAKLVYPDGTLQEAGAIVFNDGTGWNFGRHEDPFDPKFNFACEVDYCSGAALIVRASDFRRLGGFDKRYAPAYYEDTDLCFALREIGKKVIYVPDAMVIHLEGATAGRDLSSGAKQFQQRNRSKFMLKWASQLTLQPAPPTHTGLLPDTACRRQRASHVAPVKPARYKNSTRILVIDPFLPLHDMASGSLRLWRLLKMMRDLGCEITYIAVNGEGQERYANELRQLGVEVFAGDPVMMASKGFRSSSPTFDFPQLLQTRDFDFAWLSFFYTAEDYCETIRRHSPKTRVIVDSVDIHFLREHRRHSFDNAVKLDDVVKIMQRELRVYESADTVICVTPSDQQALTQLNDKIRSSVIPNIHLVCDTIPNGFENRSDLLFVGNFNHPPNVDGIVWFVENVWPLVRRFLAGVKLHVVGTNPPETVKSLQSSDIVVHGWVKDIEKHLDSARVSIAPLRYGAGMKGKIGEAMARGLPVVTTPIGAEGMSVRAGFDLEVSRDAEEMAASIVSVYTDSEKWARISRNGIGLVQKNYGTYAVAQMLESLLFTNPGSAAQK